MKKALFVFAVIAILLTGCRKPNYPGMVQIQTNEIAFLVDMTSDQSVIGSNAEIQKKDIPINGYWVRTGRFDWQGYWRPNTKVIVVSQAPVRVEWDERDNTNTVRMVSSESSGFVVPMILNAYIADKSAALKYLAAFKPVSDEQMDWSRVVQRDWHLSVKESAQPLTTALNTVVYTKIMEQLSVLFTKTPIYNAEVASKVYIRAVYEGMSAAELNRNLREAGLTGITFTGDVFSLKDWAENTYGITITAMAPGDGVIYDSKEVQTQIDNLATAFMREKTLEQEQANARKEVEVRRVLSSALEIEARQIEMKGREQILAAQAEAIKIQAARALPTTLVVEDLNMLGTLGVIQR